MSTNFKFGARSRARMVGIHPKLIAVATRALQISKIDFGVPAYGGVRTADDQFALYRDGKSKADGFEKISNHQVKDDGFGHALDVFAYVDGSASWDEHHLTHIAAAMMQAAAELGVIIEWGGFWTSFVDMPHFEYKGHYDE